MHRADAKCVATVISRGRQRSGDAGCDSLSEASNFFELAVATAISLFGLKSGAALATVVGVLIEVPVMLVVVKVVNSSRHWYQRTS